MREPAPMIQQLRVLDSFVPTRPEVCWLWRGGTSSAGYATIQQWPAHRVAYELFVGPIPDGLVIDHVCHTRDLTCPGSVDCLHKRCVNPRHLEAVTNSENSSRANWRKGVRPRPSYWGRGTEAARVDREVRAAVYIASLRQPMNSRGSRPG